MAQLNQAEQLTGVITMIDNPLVPRNLNGILRQAYAPTALSSACPRTPYNFSTSRVKYTVEKTRGGGNVHDHQRS